MTENLHHKRHNMTSKLLLIVSLAFSLSLSAETITEYWDTESVTTAKERLQIDDIEVQDLNRYNYVVTRTDDDAILISLADGTQPDDPDETSEPDDPIEPDEPEEPIESGLFDRTSKQQMLGCLTRWDNQVNSGSVTTILNSLSSMFDDKEKINFCIEDIRAVVRAAE